MKAVFHALFFAREIRNFLCARKKIDVNDTKKPHSSHFSRHQDLIFLLCGSSTSTQHTYPHIIYTSHINTQTHKHTNTHFYTINGAQRQCPDGAVSVGVGACSDGGCLDLLSHFRFLSYHAGEGCACVCVCMCVCVCVCGVLCKMESVTCHTSTVSLLCGHAWGWWWWWWWWCCCCC